MCTEIIVQHIWLDFRSSMIITDLKLHGCCWWLSWASQVLRSPRPWPGWGWESRDLRRPRAKSGLPLQRRACRACVQAAQRGCLPPTSSGLTLTRCFLQSETYQLTLPGRASFRLGSTESWRPFKRLRLCRAQGEHRYHHHHHHRRHHHCHHCHHRHHHP